MPGAEAFSHLDVPLATEPMEARLVDHIPAGEGWQFEPKWDGFRCLAFRDGDAVALMSKSGKPLERYFPEVADALREMPKRRFVLDGEIVLSLGGTLSFAALQARLHPAASRIARLSRETPAQLMLFDCLQIDSAVLIDQPLDTRRKKLETLAGALPTSIMVSPFTYSVDIAREWLSGTGGALDGVIAKRRDEPYRPGERAMFKHKVERTADCVVGGFRYDQSGGKVASLLLGLYDEAGLLHHVGYTSSFSNEARAELLGVVEPLKGESAFTGSSPGGQSRWSRPGRSEWVPLEPALIAEIAYDQVTGNRFRHGTTFRRWRPDKRAAQCTFAQLQAELRPEQLEQILGAAAPPGAR
ncbi:MAG: ATP-dependent DNA ligase [Tsuneonella sp.]